MHILKRAKRGLLDVCSGLGFSELLLDSRWRTERLLILCYHGIAMSDEDEWDPSLYIQSSLLKARFERLRDRLCNILPLAEGIQRLFAGTLPPRAVAITFDDGAYDFYAVAWPIIREFGYPVTVYVSSYYVEYNRPVFDPMCNYLIWKARGKQKSFPPVWREEKLLDASGRAQACSALGEFSSRGRLSGREKDDLLCSLAAALDIDYNDLCSRRVLHLMNSIELAEVAHSGVDIQLHTHRHRVSMRRERFMQEIDDNRRSIENLTQRPARHFCYPGGFQIPRFQQWLPECQVESATTCVPGMAGPSSTPFLLPRLVDTCGLSMQEFDAWISGLAAFLPRRPHVMSEGQVFDEEAPPVIRVERGAAARAMLQDGSFLTAWQRLIDFCPWSTCFQDPNFVATWYDCYSDQFDPLIVWGQDQAAGLTGLFPMAIEKHSGRLFVAGTVHAEYKTWLALPDHADVFADSALGRLAELFPKDHLELVYLAPGTPLGWFEKWRDRAFVRPIDRPLMRTQPADSVRASLSGKKNRARIKKLESRGPLVFERIVNPADFSAALDEITPICDFRHGAAHGVMAFRDDGLKRRFHEELMRRADGLLHITVTRLNGRIIAANIGWCNKQQVLLGTLAHSPFFAEHSPGKLHILQLGLHLEEQGFDFLDLTPGGSYKENFATGSDQSAIVDIFFSGSRARTYAWKRKAIETGKRFVSVDRVQNAVRELRRATRVISAPGLARKIGRRAVRSVWNSCEYRIYRKAAREVLEQTIHAPRRMRQDCLEELLFYKAAETWQPTLFEFLQTAMRRLEEGEHIYTLVEDGVLVHYGWLIERQEMSYFPEVDQKFQMPPQSAVLYDYFTHPAYRGRGHYQCSLREMSSDAANIAGTEFIYISVVAANAPSRHSIEKAGFEYQGSLYRKVVLGVRVRS